MVGGGVCSNAPPDDEQEGVGDDERPEGPLPGDTGYFLHSWKISFPHPKTSDTIAIVCDLPKAFKEMLGNNYDKIKF